MSAPGHLLTHVPRQTIEAAVLLLCMFVMGCWSGCYIPSRAHQLCHSGDHASHSHKEQAALPALTSTIIYRYANRC